MQMSKVKWLSNKIEVPPPKKPKKISGTYFPSVLSYDPWKTPFEAWCKNTRTYEPPFEGNKYTNAGQIIEGKVFDFLRKSMGFGDKLLTPEEAFGKDYFKRTRGDFFPSNKVFSGMWDCLITDENDKVEYVVEIKTVQVDGRSGTLDARWKDGQAPHYQALQASLYAYLLGVDKVLMVAVALKDSEGDYEHPEQVVPSYANGNVYIDEFRVSERYPNFDMYIAKATQWWNDHVLTGISPEFDEKKDAELLTALRTNIIKEKEVVFNDMISKAEQLKSEIDAVQATLTDKNKELKNTLDEIKSYVATQFRDGDTKVSFKGNKYEFVLSKSESSELDIDQLIADFGETFLGKYTKQKTKLRLTTSEIKED